MPVKMTVTVNCLDEGEGQQTVTVRDDEVVFTGRMIWRGAPRPQSITHISIRVGGRESIYVLSRNQWSDLGTNGTRPDFYRALAREDEGAMALILKESARWRTKKAL